MKTLYLIPLLLVFTVNARTVTPEQLYLAEYKKAHPNATQRDLVIAAQAFRGVLHRYVQEVLSGQIANRVDRAGVRQLSASQSTILRNL